MNKKERGKVKRAEAAFISYILLTALMVVLGTFVFSWLSDYVKAGGADVKRVVYNYDKCEYISVSIDSACMNAQSLYMNVTNRNNLRINALVIRAFDPAGVPEVKEENITIKPAKTKELKIDFNMSNIAEVQVVPVMFKDNLVIICSDRKTGTTIASC